LKELVDTWHVDEVTTIGVPFVVERNQEKDHRDMTQNSTSVKTKQSNL